MDLMDWILLLIVALTIGAYVITKMYPADLVSRWVWWFSPASVLCWIAVDVTLRFVNINAAEPFYRDIPLNYLRFWVCFWWLLTILFAIPYIREFVAYYLVRFFRHLVKCWGPSNVPPWCWLGVFGLSVIMLFIQGLPSVGPDVEDITAWVQGESPMLERYPRPLLWFWLAFFSPFVSVVSWFLTRRDDFRDMLREIEERLRPSRAAPQVVVGRTPEVARVTPGLPAGTVIPAPSPERRGILYWLGHTLLTFGGDWLFGKVFHPGI